MATIYNFKVKCVSPFYEFNDKIISKIIEESLTKFRDETTGLTLESIEVKIQDK